MIVLTDRLASYRGRSGLAGFTIQELVDTILALVPAGGTSILSAAGSELVQNLTTNVLVPITDLSVALLTDTTYRLEWFAGVTQTSATPDISSVFAFSGTFAFAGIGGQFMNGSAIGGNVFRPNLTGQQSVPLTANNFNYVNSFGSIRTTSAGTLTVEARQNNADAGNPSVIQAGTAWLMAIPIS